MRAIRAIFGNFIGQNRIHKTVCTEWTRWQEATPKCVVDFICPKKFVMQAELDNLSEAVNREAAAAFSKYSTLVTPAITSGVLIASMNSSYWNPNLSHACLDFRKVLPFFTKQSHVNELEGLLEATIERTAGQLTCEAVMYLLHSYDLPDSLSDKPTPLVTFKATIQRDTYNLTVELSYSDINEIIPEMKWDTPKQLLDKGASVIKDEVECLRTIAPDLIGRIENLYWKLIGEMEKHYE